MKPLMMNMKLSFIQKKTIPVLVILLIWLCHSRQASTQVTLSLLNINITSPLVMYDTVDFEVSVGVLNGLNPDTVTGDIFYYYLTDLMLLTLQPPRKFEEDFVSEMVPHGFVDTIPIDIQPSEIKTGPVNLIILWPAMHVPEVEDTNNLSILEYLIGFLDTPQEYPITKGNIVFPCPATQYLFIRHEEIELIKEVRIISMKGDLMAVHSHESIINGTILLDALPGGQYVVEIHYLNDQVIHQKIIKR